MSAISPFIADTKGMFYPKGLKDAAWNSRVNDIVELQKVTEKQLKLWILSALFLNSESSKDATQKE